ncbi:hypothetical protein GCM10029964_062000 [Kibdelosporangium lantanae]
MLSLPVEYADDLAAGRVSTELREQLAGHEITLPDDATVTGHDPEWWITATGGIPLVLTREPARITVTAQASCYVRYSTRDYGRCDAGYPRPLSDNWWNLPPTSSATTRRSAG